MVAASRAASVMVAVSAVHVPVLEFLGGRRAHRIDGATKAQCHAGKRMIAVDHHFPVSDVGHRVDQRLMRVPGLPSKRMPTSSFGGNLARGSICTSFSSYSPNASTGCI